MKIVTVIDRRVKALVENPNLTRVKGLDAMQVSRVIAMIAAIRVMTHPRQLEAVPTWRAHELVPGHPNVWSLKVNRNYRLTFLVRQAQQEVHLLDLEDYH